MQSQAHNEKRGSPTLHCNSGRNSGADSEEGQSGGHSVMRGQERRPSEQESEDGSWSQCRASMLVRSAGSNHATRLRWAVEAWTDIQRHSMRWNDWEHSVIGVKVKRQRSERKDEEMRVWWWLMQWNWE